MWIYKQTQKSPPLYTVGCETYSGDWESDSDHSDNDEAARRVNYLNGGKGEVYDWTPA